MTKTYRPLLATTNETIESMLTHHSVRTYADRPVDDSQIEAILSAALATATSSNQNSWSVIVVRDPERKHRLAELTLSNPFIDEAPVFLVWVADLSRVARLAAVHESSAEVLDYQEALLIGAVDVGLAAQSAVVAAESLGLGTCYVGGIRTRLEAVSNLLGLPEYAFPVVGMTVGWPGEGDAASTKPRLPLSAVSFAEVYDSAAADAGIAILETETAEYFAAQGHEDVSWTKKALYRWRSAEALNGRQHNRATIAARGFLAR